MLIHNFNLEISYSQFAVFEPSIKHPFNEWTEPHVEQGFSWREDSACFRSLIGDGKHSFTVSFNENLPDLYPKSVWAILVPMPLLYGRKFEVASIGDSVSLAIPFDVNGLMVQFVPPSSNERASAMIDLISIFSPRFAILKADGGLKRTTSLIKDARPAA